MLSSHDLNTLFSSQRTDAPGRFPQFVRRLILASCQDHELSRLDMPAGSDVRLHGWDGRLTFHGSHPFVPGGNSVWEMGVSADPRAKANGDYAKRTANPIDVDPSTTTFVFVTPRVWDGKEEWAESKRSEGNWADVRVFDGSVLASWLERVPAIALWVSDALGRSIWGLNSLDRSWQTTIANRYSPSIIPELIIGGRDTTRDQLLEFLRSPRGAISIIGETAEEALAFAMAVCRQQIPQQDSPDLPYRIIVISDPSSSEHLATLSQDHIAILTDASHYASLKVDALDHLHLIVPEKRDARANGTLPSIELGPLVRKSLVASMSEIGFSADEAERIAADSKGSLQAVLWMIAKPERGALEWANADNALDLAPLVLAGQWMVEDHPDHQVISELAQRDYPTINQLLARWSGPGNPIERRGLIWDWKARGFAWTRLVPSLRRSDVDRFLKIADAVLGAVDPALELPEEERWLANIRGKVHQHSGALRAGLLHGILLLAIHRDAIPDVDGQAHVNHFVRKLLNCPDPVARWLSLVPLLPDLAEAAPTEFLDALDKLTEDADVIVQMFKEGGMFGSSPHTHLLWALERLAWSDEYFSRVLLTLGRLDALDPGGQLMNRPRNSLQMIMLPWHPATGTEVGTRIAGLRLLFRHTEETAWNLGESLLPQSGGMSSPFVRPKWRDWAKSANEPVTIQDYWTFQEQLVELLLEYALDHGDRWAALLRAAPSLARKAPELGEKVIAALETLDPSILDRESAFMVGETARQLVMDHENMPDSEWTMKGAELERFRVLCDRLAPTTLRDRHRWLFAQWPEILREHELSWEERTSKLKQARQYALSEVLDTEEFDGLLDWAEEVEHPAMLGVTLAAANLSDDQERLVIESGLSDTGTQAQRPTAAMLVAGYIDAKSQQSRAWIDSTLDSINRTLGTPALTFFLLALPAGRDTWSLVARQSEEIQDGYWQDVGLRVLDLEDCEYAIPKLLAANRPFKVIDLLAMLVHDIGRKQVDEVAHQRVAALATAAMNSEIDHLPNEEHGVGNMITYHIDELLSYLDSRELPRHDIARLEWKFVPFLRNGIRGFRALQEELAKNPEFFVELLECIYRPSTQTEPDEHPSPEHQNRARMAYDVLDSWIRLPGLDQSAKQNNDGSDNNGIRPITPEWIGCVDGDRLKSWVQRAVDRATESDRRDMCLHRIGKLFAYSPADTDGHWPCKEVCEVIEELRSDDLDQGMLIAVSNRRGVHFVAKDGSQENAMASQFNAWRERLRLTHPRTAEILRRLAECYEHEAKAEIKRGHLDEYNRF